MAKWKVNKERINTDIPDENGNVAGGAVTYPTKRLIVDALKKVKSVQYSESTYTKENISREKYEERIKPDREEETHGVKVYDSIANYRGIDMKIAITQNTSVWSQDFVGIDEGFKVGLNIKGYTGDDYKVPRLNYCIGEFRRRKASTEKFSVTANADYHYTPSDYFNYLLDNVSNFYDNYISYCCYPLYTGYNAADDGSNYIISDKTTTGSLVNISTLVTLDLSKKHKILSFNIINSNNCYKLGAWHFHTGTSVKYDSNATVNNYNSYRLKKLDGGGYELDNTEVGGYPGLPVLFFEYENTILDYGNDNKSVDGKQLLWKGTESCVMLVRRLKRDANRRPVKNNDGSYQWKLCVHAMSDVNYMMYTWNLSSDLDWNTVGSSKYQRANNFFKNEILNGVVEYDDDSLKLLVKKDTYTSSDVKLAINTRVYAEEIPTETDSEATDDVNCALYEKSVIKERDYRTFNTIYREEWKKTKEEPLSCVDNTTCKMFKGYTQQVLPSTTIVKAQRCEIDGDVIETDEKVRDIGSEDVNFSEWRTEVVSRKDGVFVKAEFKVYFDNLDGTNISTKNYVTTDKDEYADAINKMLDKPVSSYPQIPGSDVLYWYTASNKSVVESGVELPDFYKYGEGFKQVDLFKHSGVHFYPRLRTFTPITYSVSFYGENGALLKDVSRTIDSEAEYEQIVSVGALPINLSDVPTVSNLEYWVKEADKDKTEHTSAQKYGTATTQSIDLYKNNGMKFYPIISKPEVIPMPLYVNSQGMNVVGYFDSYAVTDSLKQYATINSKSAPIINWNPQRDYMRDSESYSTLESAISAKTSDDDVVYIDEINNEYYVLKPKADSPQRRHVCFSLTSSNSRHTASIGWFKEAYTEPAAWFTYDDFPIKIPFDAKRHSKLTHLKTTYDGKEEILIVAFVRFDSRENISLSTEDSDWHWHYYHCKADVHGHTFDIYNNGNDASQNYIHYKSSGNKNTIYNWSQDAESYVNEYVKRDHWYALVEKSYNGDGSPSVALLDICYPNTDDLFEEFVDYIQKDSSTQRKCVKEGDNYIFSITIGGDNAQTYEFMIGADKIEDYFTIEYNADETIKEIRLVNKTGLIADYTNCTYTPEYDVCVDIDKNSSIKYIYNSQRSICIPEFSGCTFIKM